MKWREINKGHGEVERGRGIKVGSGGLWQWLSARNPAIDNRAARNVQSG